MSKEIELLNSQLKNGFNEIYAILQSLYKKQTPILKTATEVDFFARAKVSKKGDPFIIFEPNGKTLFDSDWTYLTNKTDIDDNPLEKFSIVLDEWISDYKITTSIYNPVLFTVVAENDKSNWEDRTGKLYHFPSRYLKFLQPGTRIIYYKGKLRDKVHLNNRLSPEAHYFGMATVRDIYKDEKSKKNDWYANLKDFISFKKPVIAKATDGFLENIPENRLTNYWRDGVRLINAKIYSKIIDLADITENFNIDYNEEFETSSHQTLLIGKEGKQKIVFSTIFERDPRLRTQALLIHGFSCFGCRFNFEKTYGEIGRNFIHIHHTKPLYETGETEINPMTDLIPLCPNCHAIVHRNKYSVLSLEELRQLIRTNRI
jgi:5-methylcytosine-specific restriction protein A